MNIKYVAFDLFGTLIKFGVQHHPFREMLKWARDNGRKVQPTDARTIMTTNGSVEDISSKLGIKPSNEMVKKIQAQIEDELSSLVLFDDVTPIIETLQSLGVKICICSNLAKPYGKIINKLLASYNLDQFLSYELGFIKPEIQIYQSILNKFNCKSHECLFIGDTLEADYIGPNKAGMKALHLNRNGEIQKNQIRSLIEIIDYLGKNTKSVAVPHI